MNTKTPDSKDTLQSLPSLLVRNARRFGNTRVALREKEFGIWQSVTWQQYMEHVRDFSLGLISLGLKPGDTLGIIGSNRPEWIYAELAAQSAGGIPLGIFQDSILAEVAYIIDHSEATMIVAEDQEQVDKILDLKEKLPLVKKIIYAEPKGLWDYEDESLIDYYEVERIGREVHEKEPDLFEKNVRTIKPDDLAIICYTSGTTGNPKGSLLTYRNILCMVVSLNEVDPKEPDDQFVSFIPLPWIVEQTMSVFSALYSGYTVNFPEESGTSLADLYEIAPSLVVAGPSMWEGLSRQVMVKHLDASFFKRFIYDLCLPIGYRWADFKFDKEKPPFLWKIIYWLAYSAMFRALRDRLGFSKVRSAMTGGAALGPDVFRFFHALGINLKQIYGQTEVAGYSTIHRDGDINFDSVGIPVPIARISIFEPDKEGVGEVISSGPGLFQGYLKNEKATNETILDGWLHSGDAGYFTPDGHLVIIDRVKDLMHLKSGARFSPMFIENKLKFCPYIVEAVVLGHEQEYVTTMICIDFKHAGKWAEDRRISYTTYSDLAAKPEVYDLIEREVVRVNTTLPEKARIEKFLLLYKELDADDEELTRTKKIRRGFINEKYKKEISGLYSDTEELPIETVIRYQDGKTATLRTNLIIRTMKPEDAYKDLLKPKVFLKDLRGEFKLHSEFQFFMQFLLSGLSMGSIYALVALGFVLIYKSTSILNLAQGEFLMVGAYFCLSMTLDFGLNFIASFMITMVFSVLLGMAVERLVLRPLIGEPIISVIMVTLGLTYILRGVVIMLWGNDIRQFNIFPEEPVDLWGVKLTYLYLWSMGISLVLLTFFAIFFKYARTGIFMRAVADHQTASQSMGISVKRIFAISWCIAAVVSSIGGILVGNIGGVGVDLSYIGLKVLPAVIFGGLDSILGAIIGGLVVGVLEFLSAGYLDPYIPALNEVFPFIVLVLVLMIKPYGLFGIEEIERV